MVRTLIIAIISLVILVGLTWSAQSRLNDLRLFEVAKEVGTTQAIVTEVVTPDMGEGEAKQNFRARVELSYEVDGKKFGRTLMPELSTDVPAKDDTLTVTYLKRAPERLLLEDEMAALDGQISGMQTLVFVLGLASIIVPFTIAGFGRKKQKRKAA